MATTARDLINEADMYRSSHPERRAFERVRAVREVGIALGLRDDGRSTASTEEQRSARVRAGAGAPPPRAGAVTTAAVAAGAVAPGIMGALVARASDGVALQLDGGEVHGLCAGCLRRGLLLERDFSRHERRMPTFQRRCNRCVDEARAKVALGAQRRRELESARVRADARAPAEQRARAGAAAAAFEAASGLGLLDGGAGSAAASRAAAEEMGFLEAVRGAHLDVVLARLARDPAEGRRPNLDSGRNALHEALAAAPAARGGAMPDEERYHIVAAMLERGQDANARTLLGRERPLHFAAQLEDPRCAVLLLAYGALPSGLNALGATPLHLATFPAIATLLTNAGASPAQRDRRGRTPYLAARERADDSLAALERAEALERRMTGAAAEAAAASSELTSALDRGAAAADRARALGELRFAVARDAQMCAHWERQGEHSVREAEAAAGREAERDARRRARLDRLRDERIRAEEEERLRGRIEKASDKYGAWIEDINRGRAEVNRKAAEAVTYGGVVVSLSDKKKKLASKIAAMDGARTVSIFGGSGW